MTEDDLKAEIKLVAEELFKKGDGAVPALRHLQSSLSKIETNDKYLSFSGFFIQNFIDDVCFNLTGDFPSDDKINDIINVFFKQLGGILIIFYERIIDNTNSVFDSLVDMVNCYLNVLAEIENEF